MEQVQPGVDQMNEVMALFMGGVKQIIPQGGLHGYKEGTVLWMYLFSNNSDAVTYLDYHASWDWLVPVIKKIKAMHLDILKQAFVMDYMKSASQMNSGLISLDIDKTHRGVYEFLIWYNRQKQ